MIRRIYNNIKRRIVIFSVNKIFNGTNPHYFNIKRTLLNSIGWKIGVGTKIVGPIYNTGTLIIGNNCWIGTNFTVHGNGTVMLGDNIDVGPDVTFLTGTHEIGTEIRRAGKGYNCTIKVGSVCWIGGRSTFVNNINIGEASVIAAGALVCKSFLNNELHGGVPARLIKELN